MINDVLKRGCELVLDTHAIVPLLKHRGLVEFVKVGCHTLVIPDVLKELRVHIGYPLTVFTGMHVRLRGKFIQRCRAGLKLPEDLASAKEKQS